MQKLVQYAHQGLSIIIYGGNPDIHNQTERTCSGTGTVKEYFVLAKRPPGSSGPARFPLVIDWYSVSHKGQQQCNLVHVLATRWLVRLHLYLQRWKLQHRYHLVCKHLSAIPVRCMDRRADSYRTVFRQR